MKNFLKAIFILNIFIINILLSKAQSINVKEVQKLINFIKTYSQRSVWIKSQNIYIIFNKFTMWQNEIS